MSQHLKQLISTQSSSLGSTPTGQQWCLKALHPSDPETEVRGIPDCSSVPSVLMNYQSTFTLSAQAGATGTWSFDAQMIPHPVGLLSAIRTDSISTTPVEFLNSQLAGATHAAKMSSFCQQFKRWRLAYMGVTVHQNGPAMSDQGSIVVCQPPVSLVSHSLCSWFSTTPGLVVARPVASLKLSDRASYENSQTLPNSYLANSRDGVYVPLKLTQTDQKWYSMADSISMGLDRAVVDPIYTNDLIILPTGPFPTGTGGYYPFLSLAPAHVPSQTSGVNCDETSCPLNETWANISVRGASTASSYTFFVRLGLECQCAPGSIMSPQQRISPVYDPEAIRAYYAVSRELKDAYPADYNDLGTLWKVIKDLARKSLPLLKTIPHPMVQGAATVGDLLLAPSSVATSPRQPQQKQRGKKQPVNRQGTTPRSQQGSPKTKP